MEFIDLKAQQKRIRDKIEEAIKRVLDHGRYIMGPEVEELEKVLARYVNVKYALTCSSGTDALLLSLMALNIGRGDAVITTPFTFVATAEVISLLGAVPVFVDIDEDTFNMDVGLLPVCYEQAEHKGLRPKCIIPVDIFGLPCEYERIKEFSKEKGLLVVEDAAQSFGAQYNQIRACALGDIGCTSFFPAKPLGCYGDGGAVFTEDDYLIEILKSLRVHGQGRDKYENIRIGLNGRMDTVQAAILLEKIRIFDQEMELRQVVARRYVDLISEYAPEIKTQKVPEGLRSSWAQFTVKFPSRELREKAQRALKENGVPTAVYYPVPLHLQKAFAYLGYKRGDLPVAEETCLKVLSLPMHPYLSEEEQVRVVKLLGDILKKSL